MRSKQLAPPENLGINSSAGVRLNTDAGDKAVSVWSATIIDVGLKPLQPPSRSLHDDSLLQNSGRDLTVIKKVTIGRRAEKYLYSNSFFGSKIPSAMLRKMHHNEFYMRDIRAMEVLPGRHYGSAAASDDIKGVTSGGKKVHGIWESG